jgi:molecular chaperone GrpE
MSHNGEMDQEHTQADENTHNKDIQDEFKAHGGTHASDEEGSEEDEISKLKTELEEKDKKYLYLYAEYETYKKRAIKERSEAMKFGWEAVARDLLDVLDNFDRAMAHISPGTDKNLLAGLQMIQKQFRETLEKRGVKEVEALGKDFDPYLHEAVGQEPSEQYPESKITREESKGYTLHGRLLRPTRVIVSTGKGEK